MKTNFSKNELSEILSQYNLGELIDSKPLANGSIQINILLQTTKGKFVFRYYKQVRLENSVLFEVNLIRYLKNKNYPCPASIKDKYGNIAGCYDNKPYVIFEFIEGKHLNKPNNAQQKELIKMVAQLHNITKTYNPFHKNNRWNYGIELCQDLAQRRAGQINTPDSREKLIWLESELAKLKIPISLPKGICHCDFHFTNVLYLNGVFNSLIDFDDANYTYLVFDLIYLIEPFVTSFNWHNWQTHANTDIIFDFKQTKRVVSEYEKYRTLNNNEKRHLFDVYKLSILLDCVWYFERGNARDFYEKRKIDYLNDFGREKFYQNIFN
ncbi:MAG: homoserine kinase [Lentisphaerota bacterium]